MKVLLIVALLCVAHSKAAAVPVGSEAVAADAPKGVPEEAVKFEVQALEGNLNDSEAEIEDAGPQVVFTTVRMFCPDGWFNYESKCYIFVNTPLSWFEAEKHCNEFGASLASTGSSSEYRYLQQITRTANRASAWIGGFYLQGSWLWIDRSGMYYTNWHTQSSPASCSCMYLQSTVGQGWRNAACGAGYPFICVKNYRC
ncbi:ladderlectin isoform X1 [Esox lucius]|uniref:C-type lectin domain-containing protein n=1 Tax=Esox lucius TaxID=8010 RepID=A0A3P9AA87_ESOLU|nr:ladderlectin isoform X1 [Esox lucius]